MDPKLLCCSPKCSATAPAPFLHHFLDKPRIPLRPLLRVTQKTLFLGGSLILARKGRAFGDNSRKGYVPFWPVRAVVKRRKELPLDNVIQRDKKLKLVLKIKKILVSLTVEKRTLADHLTHLREEFRFSQQLRGTLIRHPDLFYVSLKGERDSVFLRKAYGNSHLIEKDRLLLIKEKLRSLVNVHRFPRRNASRRGDDGGERTDDQEGESGLEDEEDWTDVDKAIDEDDGFYDDNDEDCDDDWTDEDDNAPPDFTDDVGSVKMQISNYIKQADTSRNKDQKVLAPVFPDGRPRQRW